MNAIDHLERAMYVDEFENVPTETCAAVRALLADARKHQAKDRGALLRMAGNIACGLATDNAWANETEAQRTIATCAVAIAKAIIAEVDK